MARILVADPIAQEGINRLTNATHDVDVNTGQSADALLRIISDYDALVVRSETQVTAELLEMAPRLQVIGRAGVGVDNIDISAATQKGLSLIHI